ncbi:MAG: patatin family protein [Parasporobacterium sp.]|nr:patatin family protein [Parasporobacterium sp.]
MLGIIDVGGANRAVFADGVFDRLLEEGIMADYCIGVSAGAANCISYIAKQKGRNLEFYTKYNFSSRSIGLFAWLKTGGSFVDLNYIYGTLSNSNGKCPLDFEAVKASPAQFKIVATDSETAEPVYFDKSLLQQDDYRAICASSCTPEVCKPYPYNGRRYFDGYVSDPLPVERALSDGCDRLVIILTLPKTHMRSSRSFERQAEKLKKYPAISGKLKQGADLYNRELQLCLELEEAGKALILHPEFVQLHPLEKDKSKILALYQEGYEKGAKVKDFLKASQCTWE